MGNIKCNGVNYRQGYLEVMNVHDGFVNLEVWKIHPDIDISNSLLESSDIEDKDVVGNVEIELSADNVKDLILRLNKCLEEIND